MWDILQPERRGHKVPSFFFSNISATLFSLRRTCEKMANSKV